tara:strand:- start:989 stop:1852 length:864 start_codon:yes stop_codon:yes gene_type:complete
MADLPIMPAFHAATIKQGLSFVQQIEIAHIAGFSYTGLNIKGAVDFDNTNSQGATKSLLKTKGLSVRDTSGAPPLTANEEDFTSALTEMPKLLGLAKELGASATMVFVPNRWDSPKEEVLPLVASRLKKIAKVAADFEIQVGIEYCGPPLFPDKKYPFLTGIKGALQMAEKAGNENIGLTLDPCHFNGAGDRIDDIEAASGRITCLHINDMPEGSPDKLVDADRVMPGDGIMDLVGFLQAVVNNGYRGPCAVELFNPEIRKGDPTEVATEARLKTETVIAQAFGKGG